MVLTCPDLDELCTGTFHLSVPLVDDVIQIGIGGDPDVGTIEVTKSATALRVRRVDGRPMQAELLTYHPGDTGPVLRTTVFDQPVRCLVLERFGTPGLWIGTSTTGVDHETTVGQFVRTIATFGLAKQRRGYP